MPISHGPALLLSTCFLTKNKRGAFSQLLLFVYDLSMPSSWTILHVQGSAIGTTGMPMPFRGPPLEYQWCHWLPVLPAIGCQFSRQPRAWVKLPTQENDVIQDGVENAEYYGVKIQNLAICIFDLISLFEKVLQKQKWNTKEISFQICTKVTLTWKSCLLF